MKELIVNKEKITIRKAKESDAEVLIEYLNIIGGQSNDLTFGEGEFGRTVEAEREFIKNALEKNNVLYISIRRRTYALY
ncbi:hypothetical protein [Clostridium thailandense]|uniref:hypothetical protein n=1 Tax=Clostridium thailandense TaxID=2794346 RepID=UPI003988B065